MQFLETFPQVMALRVKFALPHIKAMIPIWVGVTMSRRIVLRPLDLGNSKVYQRALIAFDLMLNQEIFALSFSEAAPITNPQRLKALQPQTSVMLIKLFHLGNQFQEQ
jgi:hypothetical protein